MEVWIRQKNETKKTHAKTNFDAIKMKDAPFLESYLSIIIIMLSMYM